MPIAIEVKHIKHLQSVEEHNDITVDRFHSQENKLQISFIQKYNYNLLFPVRASAKSNNFTTMNINNMQNRRS